jgi:Cutinase
MSITRPARLVLPGLAIAALLALGAGALPASAATPRPEATGTCDTTPVFFGLHGMAEGPSGTISAISPEIMSFDADQNAISGAVLNAPVPYPTVYPNAWSVVFKTYYAISTGEQHLQAAIKSYTAGCSVSQDKIALVGYSMGAWVINKWIVDHPLEWDMVKAVVLFGDPCWVDGNDQGLVRRWAGGYGCMPAADYPYPLPGGTTAVPFPVESWSTANDPVTGADWGGKTRSAQLTAAENCTTATTCSHLDYTDSTAIYDGAQFVVSQLVG